MSVLDRLYGWNTGVLAIYPDNADPADVNTDSPFYNFLGLYQGWRFRTEGRNHDNRATHEKKGFPLPVYETDTVEVGSVVEGASLLQLYVAYGRGPYWLWFVNGDGNGFRGRAIINATELTNDGNTQTQSATLEMQGGFEIGILGGS